MRQTKTVRSNAGQRQILDSTARTPPTDQTDAVDPSVVSSSPSHEAAHTISSKVHGKRGASALDASDHEDSLRPSKRYRSDSVERGRAFPNGIAPVQYDSPDLHFTRETSPSSSPRLLHHSKVHSIEQDSPQQLAQHGSFNHGHTNISETSDHLMLPEHISSKQVAQEGNEFSPSIQEMSGRTGMRSAAGVHAENVDALGIADTNFTGIGSTYAEDTPHLHAIACSMANLIHNSRGRCHELRKRVEQTEGSIAHNENTLAEAKESLKEMEVQVDTWQTYYSKINIFIEQEVQAEKFSGPNRKHLEPVRADVNATLTTTITEREETAAAVLAAKTKRQLLHSELDGYRRSLQQEEARAEGLESWKYGGPSPLPTPSAAIEALPAMLPFVGQWLRARLLRLSPN
ncbi:hypothetical protein LTR49_026564 [Elasticomyces elasticus]|nr:hypothetical protein LTR49_026564 [Elasticomyces elasticus]